MKKSLFLSTVTREFGSLRADLADHFNRLNCGIDVHHQDAFFHPGTGTLQMLAQHVKECSVLVHVIGADSGWILPTEQVTQFLRDNPSFESRFSDVARDARAGKISATQWEAWLSVFFGKKLHSYSFPGRLAAGSSQNLHANRLVAAHLYPKPVSNERALLLEILGSLHDDGWLTKEQAGRKIATSRILKHAPRQLFGRDKWLNALDAAWANPNLHVYTLVAWGGVGKTSLVAHWVSHRLAAKGWLDVERYFDWSFYSQGTGESRQTSSDLFISEALKFFGDPDPVKGTPWERGERLAGLVRRHRTLLILDGIEPLQYPINDPQAGRLKDQALEALLQNLAADNCGLCIVTTREHLKNIESQATTEEQKLDRLEKEAAIALLRHLEITGTDDELEAARVAVDGHALSLQLLGRFLFDAHGGDIRHMSEVKFEEADKERQGRSAFKIMLAYEKWLASAGPERQRELAILRLTGLFDRPISRDCLDALRAEPAIAGLTDDLVKLREAQWNTALARLREVDLLSVAPDTIDAHPLIREYFAKQLKETQPEAFKEAHSRLFDYLCESTPLWPDTIEGLAPLYQAIVHGCLAGRQQRACDDVYSGRILRRGSYSVFKLGAIGADLAAVAAFFDEYWRKVTPNLAEADQAWLVGQAAYYLRALGRLTEASQPMRISLELAVQREDWQNAAISAGNLSELELTFGRLAEALADARVSVQHADRSGDWFERIIWRTAAADALHQSGRRQEAGQLFAEAERMQRESQPELELLYSLQGFHYCDWLLAPAERDGWNLFCGGASAASDKSGSVAICDEVLRRAIATLKWMLDCKVGLLSVAVNRLTLARVGLIRAALSGNLPEPRLDLPDAAIAVNGLRNAGAADHLPGALLTSAWYHAVRGEADIARKNLDEAWQIAERGPMPLYMADVHLHRARLFRDKAELAKAAELIRKLGYGRRYDELADAEEAAKTW